MLKKENILIGQTEINAKVREIARAIDKDYRGKEILFVGVLKGAVVFLADLIRFIETPSEIDFIAVSSYGASTKSSGVVRIVKDLDRSIEGREIIIVEDIIDTGLTLKFIAENFKQRKPLSIRIVAFLDKPARRRIDIEADYRGFVIPDHFVVGYGLDYNEKYRHMPDIYLI
ncbi:MAG: hypoxanthine phosphoribosyltransferase [Firmicutes bacterium]|nr:hypoxanthine phosphoribosyltransferase [Bacillota bacterium]